MERIHAILFLVMLQRLWFRRHDNLVKKKQKKQQALLTTQTVKFGQGTLFLEEIHSAPYVQHSNTPAATKSPHSVTPGRAIIGHENKIQIDLLVVHSRFVCAGRGPPPHDDTAGETRRIIWNSLREMMKVDVFGTTAFTTPKHKRCA